MGKKIMFTLMFLASMLSGVEAATIKNLERTRANTVAVILDMNINPNQRIQKVEKARLKLLDMERITINDGKISKNPSLSCNATLNLTNIKKPDVIKPTEKICDSILPGSWQDHDRIIAGSLQDHGRIMAGS